MAKVTITIEDKDNEEITMNMEFKPDLKTKGPMTSAQRAAMTMMELFTKQFGEVKEVTCG